jgi:uncharacterized protein (UPF0297 family)
VIEALLHEPGCFDEIRARLTVNDFGPEEQTRELAEALFATLEEGGQPSLASIYGRLETPEAAYLLSELDAAGQQKNNLRDQLDQALKTLEQQKHLLRTNRLKQRLDKDEQLKQMLSQIAQKGPNLRSGGI